MQRHALRNNNDDLVKSMMESFATDISCRSAAAAVSLWPLTDDCDADDDGRWSNAHLFRRDE